jgi:hypothetical protein
VGRATPYSGAKLTVVFMAISKLPMNRFERILFRAALALAALVLIVRLGFAALTWYLHHVR